MERSRLMYIENKSGGIPGLCVIGRVSVSKTGKTLRYKGMTFERIKGQAVMANYQDVDTGGRYWISGPRKDQKDRLTGDKRRVTIDTDVAEEYAALISG